jgi:hypothetical protein
MTNILTLEDIPAAPPLRNRDPSKGSIQKHMVLAYVMTWDEIVEWAVKHGVSRNNRRGANIDRGWEALRKRIPRKCGFGTVTFDKGGGAPCWILASNKSEKHLKRAEDLVLIEKVRQIIGTDEAPRWYR